MEKAPKEQIEEYLKEMELDQVETSLDAQPEISNTKVYKKDI